MELAVSCLGGALVRLGNQHCVAAIEPLADRFREMLAVSLREPNQSVEMLSGSCRPAALPGPDEHQLEAPVAGVLGQLITKPLP
jgi:hypothetical protein